jgi:nucleotide-binding universal stress UspA family protein
MADPIKTILAPATGNPDDSITLDAALTIARAFSAHIDVLHVRVDPLDAAMVGDAVMTSIVDQIAREADEREAAVKRWFNDFCAREKVSVLDTPAPDQKTPPSVQWHVETGDDARSVAAMGLFADLIVAARAEENSVTNRMVLEAALLETARPLLIPTAKSSRPIIGGTVAIAWKGTPQTVRAVAAAMPFLTRANEIVLLTVSEGDDGGNDAFRLIRNLAWHGLQARREHLSSSGDPAETLLSAAAQNAGLLVMGGYGHSRLREWVFGGFTQRVLEGAPLPVLLAH